MKGALGCKPRRSLGWSGAIGSKDGAAPCHSGAKPMCTGLGLHTSPESCLTAPCLSFPLELAQKSEGASLPLQHKHTPCLCILLWMPCWGRVGNHTACSSPGKEFVGFSSPVKLKQSKTPLRIWFPSPSCKNLLLLSNTLLQIYSGFQSFCSVTL